MTNSAFDERFGYEEGMECYTPFHQETRCERCLSHEVMLSGETQRLTRKLSGRVYSVTVSPLKDEGEKTIAAVEVFRDITLDYNIKQNLLMQNAKMQKDLQLARKLQEALVKGALPKVGGDYELTAGASSRAKRSAAIFMTVRSMMINSLCMWRMFRGTA